MSRIDAMRWTPHMEESLSVLAEAKECSQDELLVAQVKLHLILDKVHQLRRDGEPLPSLAFYLSTFKKELDNVKSQIPPYLQQHKVLLMHLYNAEIIINEISIGNPAVPHAFDINRLDSLSTSLQATKGWLDVWLELEGQDYLEAPPAIFFQFTRTIVNLYKLTVLEDPAWSKTMVRDTANVLEYLDRNEVILKRCTEALSPHANRELYTFERGLRMVRGLKMNWEPKLVETWRLDIPANSAVDTNMMQAEVTLPDVMAFNSIDESWMTEFLRSL
ncbi:hypothetical protein N7457_009250 [Penicillium paradoxum]|uniref:uncharacterized protein n=1 Tax=Penicillium paradoxum TaxID=176176 RepID=UPI00254675CD|nr:uncharacterized protein N7457_009250 [Penicillium paradoxum]KAJ5774354.1 hypothetical protein N7457_009250 [Penicillium paradoxum]